MNKWKKYHIEFFPILDVKKVFSKENITTLLIHVIKVVFVWTIDLTCANKFELNYINAYYYFNMSTPIQKPYIVVVIFTENEIENYLVLIGILKFSLNRLYRCQVL
ncbi:hypothetical protein BLOT_008771 [Blomia tropicalis]|nr:hypothetical protein BLOT_008771 [Blomia tropicalis]